MRRFVASVALACLLASPVSAAEPPRIIIDNAHLSVPPEQAPFITGGRTMVPLRTLFEALGAAVEWNQADRTVTAVKGNTAVRLQINATVANVNGREVALDQPPVLVDSRTFIPLRFVGEAFGAQVTWVEESRTVAVITRPAQPGAPLALAPAPAALVRSTQSSQNTLVPSGDAIFFLNVQTGAVEGWSVPGAERESIGYGASADGRYVIARSKETGWVVDRTTGQTHQWNRRQHDLIIAAAGLLLFEETRTRETATIGYDGEHGILSGHLGGTGRFTVVQASDMKAMITFTLPNETGRLTQPDEALFSPDATRVVIAGDEVHSVDLRTGTSEVLVIGKGRLQPVKGGTEFVAFLQTAKGQMVRRMTWNGDIQAGGLIEAKWIDVSPDGEWAAWEVVMENFTPTVFYAKLSEVHNPTRALGATMCYGMGGRSGSRWGSDGIVVYTKEGMRVLTRDGAAIRPAALGPDKWGDVVPDAVNGGRMGFRKWDQNGYTLGALDQNGNPTAAVTVVNQQGLPLLPHKFFPLWGATDDELRFAVRSHYGSGGPCGDYAMPLPVRVEKPGTFDWHLKLEVTGTDSCLNVRTEPSRSAAAVTCLADGTVLDLGNDADWESLPHFVHNAEGQWFKLQTAEGSEGWVLISSGYVKFAD